MSPRKPTIDDLDDTDDEDGVLEDQKRRDSDLKLGIRRPDDVGLGGTGEAENDQREGRRNEG
jgi:hypothetical protein